MNSTNTADTITNVLKDQINDITRQLTTKTNTLHNLVQDVTFSATAIKNNVLNKATLPAQVSPTSYAAAVQNFTSIEHTDVIARGINTDKQLLILTNKTLTSTNPTELTEKDLVAKANTALELMVDQPIDKPTLVTFVAAKKLHNGNVLFQLNSIAAASWLKNPDVQKAFLLTYSSSANIHNKLFHVITEFVPITLDAGTPHSHMYSARSK